MPNTTEKPKTNRFAALKQANTPASVTPTAAVTTSERPLTAPTSRAATRVGTKQIGGHFPPEVLRVLKTIGIEQDKTVQVMLGEALDMYFQAHGKATIASRVQDKAAG